MQVETWLKQYYFEKYLLDVSIATLERGGVTSNVDTYEFLPPIDAWGFPKYPGNTTVALVEEEEEASPAGSPKKTAATSGELAEPLPPAPGPLGSGIRSSQGADCRCDCGSADERARPL